MINMQLEYIISAYNNDVIRAFGMLLPEQDGVCYLIVHQVDNGVVYDYASLMHTNRNDCRIITMDRPGLALSRNYGLINSIGDLLVPTDSDVTLNDKFTKTVRLAFLENPNADLITFQALTPEGRPRRSYRQYSHIHNKRTILGVSSIEIAFKKSSLRTRNVAWDEDFGIGQKFGGCLENAFMANILKSGLVAIYYPAPIAVHPQSGSGQVYDIRSARTRGALFKKIFGNLSYVVGPTFCVKKYRDIKQYGAFIPYIFEFMSSAYRYHEKTD